MFKFLLAFLTLFLLTSNAFAVKSFYHTEDLGISTTTSSSFQTKTSLTINPAVSQKFDILWSVNWGLSSTSNQFEVQLRDTTNNNVLGIYTITPQATGDQRPAFGITQYVDSGSGTPITLALEYRSIDGTHTATIREANLIAISHDTVDQYAETISPTTDALGSYVDYATLTFSPASTGNYIVLATAETGENSLSYAVETTLDIDGTLYSDATQYDDGLTDSAPWGTLVNLSLSNASHTLKVKFKTTNVLGTATIQRARVLAIRVDNLINSRYFESRTRLSTSSTSNQTCVNSGNFTPAYSSEAIEIGNNMVDGGDVTKTIAARYVPLTGNNNAVVNRIITPSNTSTKIPQLWFAYRVLPPVADSYFSQYSSGSAGVTVGASDCALEIMNVGPVGPARLGSSTGAGR